MKLFLIFGIFLCVFIQTSFQLPIGKNDRRILPFPDRRDSKNIEKTFIPTKKLEESRGIRAVSANAGKKEEDSDKVVMEKSDGIQTMEFNLGEGVHTAVENSESADIDFESSQQEIQIVKRGWFKKIWKKIKDNVITGVLKSIFTREILETKNSKESENIDDAEIPHDFIGIEIEGVENESEKEVDKEIEIVKRGFFKKVIKKIKNTVVGTIIGGLVGISTKRSPEAEQAESQISSVKGNLPLLLKTLRLRPGTADEITKIVEDLGSNEQFQDQMVNEILNDSDAIEISDNKRIVRRKCKMFGLKIRCTLIKPKSETAINDGKELQSKAEVNDETILNDVDEIKQMVKRGWFQKIWEKIKKAVLDGVLKSITSRGAMESGNIDEASESDDFDYTQIPNDIIGIELEGAENEDEKEVEKEIEIVKRGWFKKLRRKIKNTVLGAVDGVLVKRNHADEEIPETKLPPGTPGQNLPLLLKTLRLRPGTADEITKIVEDLGSNVQFQDQMVDEIINDSDAIEISDNKRIIRRKCKMFGFKIRCTLIKPISTSL